MSGELTKKVRALAAKERMWQSGDRILVACSGGPDSLALAHWLVQESKVAGFAVAVMYVHHHLRKSADLEPPAVEYFARQEGIPFYRADIEVRAEAAATGESIETAARRLRYQAIRQVAAAEGYGKIATAHHADDQAETILHHILRGTGTRGLIGMRPCTSDIIRPFLKATRADIEAYLENVPYSPCIDETNADTHYLRNALRHEVLPYLRRYNPQISMALCRLGEIAGEDEDCLAASAQTATKLLRVESKDIVLARSDYDRFPPAVRHRLLRYICEEYMAETPDRDMILRLDEYVRKGRTGLMFRAWGWELEITATQARWRKAEAREDFVDTAVYPDVDGKMQLGDVRAYLRKVDTIATDGICIPVSLVQGNLCLRYRRPGDRIRTRAGSKKWKDWLIDHKVPRSQRDKIVLLADDVQVYWADKYAVAEIPLVKKDEYYLVKVAGRAGYASQCGKNTGDKGRD